MQTTLTKRQRLFYRLYVVAPNNFVFFKKKTFSIAELEKQLDGSKRSGYTRQFLNELVEMTVLEFDKEEFIQGHWVKKYKINLKKLENYLVNTEWYVLTREIIDSIEPPVV